MAATMLYLYMTEGSSMGGKAMRVSTSQRVWTTPPGGHHFRTAWVRCVCAFHVNLTLFNLTISDNDCVLIGLWV